jgi:hypothetical protein
MAVVLFPASNEVPTLQPATLAVLAGLGLTSVSLVRDDEMAGIVLEGWAFDPGRAHEAASAVTGGCAGARTLQMLAQMAVSSAQVNNQWRTS